MESKYKFEDLFDLYDYKNQLVKKDKKDKLSEYSTFIYRGSCFKDYGEMSIQLRNTSLSNIFRSKKIIIKTHCPLFQWILCNEENRRILKEKGLLTNYNSSATSEVNGFFYLSSILHRFRINPSILKEARRRLPLDNGQSVNGMHIRIGRHRGFQDNSFFLYEDDIPRFAQCAKKFHLEGNHSYVASDSPIAKEYYSNSSQWKNYIVSSTVAKHTEGSTNKTVYSDAFVDMIALSLCSSLVGTWRSSYTTISGTFQGNIPFYILRGWIGACRENVTVRFGYSVCFNKLIIIDYH